MRDGDLVKDRRRGGREGREGKGGMVVSIVRRGVSLVCATGFM